MNGLMKEEEHLLELLRDCAHAPLPAQNEMTESSRSLKKSDIWLLTLPFSISLSSYWLEIPQV